jgi:hypothetical protein
MSGQEVTVVLVDAPTLSLGGFTPRRQTVGAFDTSGFSTELADVRASSPSRSFADIPFTVEHARGAVIVESPATLEMRVRDGAVVAVRWSETGRRSTPPSPRHPGRQDDRGRDRLGR